MDLRAQGAVDLLVALHDVTAALRDFGYGQYLSHPSVDWELIAFRYGTAEPMARAGCRFRLRDDPEGMRREILLVVDLTVRNAGFVVEATAEIDEPLEPGGAANVRDLVTLPTVRTTDLTECLAALRAHARHLCSQERLLDDLGVPRHP